MKVRKTKRVAQRPIATRVAAVRISPVAAAVATALGTVSGTVIADERVQEVPVAVTALTASGLTGTEEIVVSATRRDTGVQDVPYNLSAITGADIDALQIRDLSGIARWTPGLTQVDQGARNANQLFMRGINTSPINTNFALRNTTGDRVGVFFGETPVYIDLRPVDLNRVEVLRGPQSTLFGARATSGALRYIPNKPDVENVSLDAIGRAYTVSESSDQGLDGILTVNTPIVEDVFAFRASLAVFNVPGFIDQNYLVNEAGVSCPEPFFTNPGCTEDDLSTAKDTNDEKTVSVRLGALWNVTENLEAVLTYQRQDMEVGGRPLNSQQALALIDSDPNTVPVEPLQSGLYESGMRFLEPIERINDIYNLVLTYDAGNIEFVSATSYTEYNELGTRDQTDLLLDYSYGNFPFVSAYADFPAFAAFTRDEIDDNFFTQEFRAVYDNVDSRWDWLVGAFYQDADQFAGSDENAPGYRAFVNEPPVNEDTLNIFRTDRETTELAFYGELGYDLSDKLHVLGGARWFEIDDDISAIGVFIDPFYDFDEQGGGSESDVLFKLSADYTFNDDILGYALFSQGVSPGGVNTSPGLTPAQQFVSSEFVDNYEIGLRSVYFDGNLIINGALFYMDWQDLQLDAEAPNGSNITVNGGGAKSQGLELEASARLGDYWNVGLGYAYTDATLTEGCTLAESNDPNVPCALRNEETQDGDRLPGSPKHQANLLIAFNTPLNDTLLTLMRRIALPRRVTYSPNWVMAMTAAATMARNSVASASVI